MAKKIFSKENSGRSDMDFKVYPEQGVVVCRLLYCRDIAIRRILKYTGEEFVSSAGELLIDNVFYGVARCNPEDKFDEQYGMELALAKAKRKRGIAINRAIQKYIERTQRGLDDLAKYGIHDVPKIPGEGEQ